MFPGDEATAITNDNGMNGYDNNVDIENMVLFQVDYHFSDINLAMDNYLLSRMNDDPEYWIPVKIVANLTKIRSLTKNENVVLEAIKKSNLLILNGNHTKVKRPNFIPPKPKQHKDLRRTAFVYGLPKNITREKVVESCCAYGTIRDIIFDDPTACIVKGTNNYFVVDDGINLGNKYELSNCEGLQRSDSIDFNNNEYDLMGGPNREIALTIMAKRFGNKPKNRLNNCNSNSSTNSNVTFSSKSSNNSDISQTRNSTANTNTNPNGNLSDFLHLRSCFVVFESQVLFFLFHYIFHY